MGFENHTLLYLGPEKFTFKGVQVEYYPLSMKHMLELKQIQHQAAAIDPAEIAMELRMLQEELESDHAGIAKARLQRLIASADHWESGLADNVIEALCREARILLHNWEAIENQALEAWTAGDLRYVNLVAYLASFQSSKLEAMERALRLLAEAGQDEEVKKKFGPRVQAILTSIPPQPLSFLSSEDIEKPKSSTGHSPSIIRGSNGSFTN